MKLNIFITIVAFFVVLTQRTAAGPSNDSIFINKALHQKFNLKQAALAIQEEDKIHQDPYWALIAHNEGKNALIKIEALLKKQPNNYVAIVDKVLILTHRYFAEPRGIEISADEALKLLEDAHRLNPNFYGIYSSLSSIVGDEVIGEKFGSIANDLNPNDPDSALWRAQVNILRNTNPGSIEPDLAKALQSPIPAIRNRAAMEFIRLARLRDRDKNLGRAKAELDKLIHEFPNFSWAYPRLMEWAMEVQDFKAYETYLKRYQELEPNAAAGFEAAGMLADRFGDWPKCIASFKRSIEVGGTSSYRRACLAACFVSANNLKEAKLLLDQSDSADLDILNTIRTFQEYTEKSGDLQGFLDWQDAMLKKGKLPQWGFDYSRCLSLGLWPELNSDSNYYAQVCDAAISSRRLDSQEVIELQSLYALGLLKRFKNSNRENQIYSQVAASKDWKLSPVASDRLWVLAKSLNRSNEFLTELEAYVLANPSAIGARLALGNYKTDLGQNQEAAKLLKDVDESSMTASMKVDFFLTKAELSETEGNLNKAAEFAKKAFEAAPNASNLNTYASLLRKAKGAQASTKVIEDSLKELGTDPIHFTDPELLYNIAVGLVEGGDCNKAKPLALKAAMLSQPSTATGSALSMMQIKCNWPVLRYGFPATVANKRGAAKK